MIEPLLDRLDQLNLELDQLQASIADIDATRFNAAPSLGKWSAAQIMHHLIRAEQLSLKYCQKKLSFQPKLKRAGIAADFRSALVHYCMVLPFKFEAPPGMGTEHLPVSSRIDETFETWKLTRSDWKEFFKQLPAEYIDKEVYKHPVGGRLSWRGMLRFFGSHYHHHYPQIMKALK